MAQFAVHGEHVEHEAASPIANAAPLGLSAFALTMALLSCINAGFIVPSTGINIFVGIGLFYGGIVQILAGMWEFKRGNVIPATAFSSYEALGRHRRHLHSRFWHSERPHQHLDDPPGARRLLPVLDDLHGFFSLPR